MKVRKSKGLKLYRKAKRNSIHLYNDRGYIIEAKWKDALGRMNARDYNVRTLDEVEKKIDFLIQLKEKEKSLEWKKERQSKEKDWRENPSTQLSEIFADAFMD